MAPWHTMKRPLYDIIIRSSGFNPEPAGFEPNPPVDKAFPPLASLPFSLSLSLSLSLFSPFPLFSFFTSISYKISSSFFLSGREPCYFFFSLFFLGGFSFGLCYESNTACCLNLTGISFFFVYFLSTHNPIFWVNWVNWLSCMK